MRKIVLSSHVLNGWRGTLRSFGGTNEERAEALGISESTLRAWLRRPPQALVHFASFDPQTRRRLVMALRQAVAIQNAPNPSAEA